VSHSLSPINLRVREITYLRYCTASTGHFSATSLNWIARILPCSAPHPPKFDSNRRYFCHSWPTWTPYLQPSFLRDGYTFLLLDCFVQRFFVASTSSSSSHQCCLVTASQSQILDFASGALLADTAFFAMQLSVLHAITKACPVVRDGVFYEIVAFHPSPFEFVRYNSCFLRLPCLDRLTTFRDKIQLYICQPAKAEGFQLAIAGCSLPGESLEVLPPLYCISKQSLRQRIFSNDKVNLCNSPSPTFC
jgi:hypothetical protein